MFLFAETVQNTISSIQEFPSQRRINLDEFFVLKHNLTVLHSADGVDNVQVLNVPFCINFMTDGSFSTGKQTFTSISGSEVIQFQNSEPSKSMSIEITELHQHDYFEMMYVLSGQVEQHIENGCYIYRKGQACLLNRNTRHCEVLGENFFLLFLCFSKEYLIESLNNGSVKADKDSTLYKFLNNNLENQVYYKKDYIEYTPISQNGADMWLADKLLETMAREIIQKQPGNTFMVRGLQARLFSCLQDPELYSCTHVTLDSTAEAYLFNRITRFMEQKEGRVTRSELAEYLNYSSDYINRIVKKHTGMNLSEYNLLICMKKAEKKLLDTKQSISDIIAALGFENKTYFYRLFEKRHGITPMEFRQKYKKEEACH